MNDSCSPNLSVQGQGMNLANVNTPSNRWGDGPKGTIVNILERAKVYDHTMTSTMNNETSDINLKALSNRVNPDKKNETYVIHSSKTNASSNSSNEISKKPIEELNNKSKQDKSQK